MLQLILCGPHSAEPVSKDSCLNNIGSLTKSQNQRLARAGSKVQVQLNGSAWLKASSRFT